MIPQETIDKILDRADIVDVIDDYVKLTKKGRDYVACCPFHKEKTPSFRCRPHDRPGIASAHVRKVVT